MGGPSSNDVRARGAARDRVAVEIGCLATDEVPMTLVSTAGFHCDVWRGALVGTRDGLPLDFVLKCYKQSVTPREVAVMRREYLALRGALEELVPEALFVATQVGGHDGVVVIARTCTPWFDLSNPGNEVEALPLLSRQPKARAQLARFVAAARRWVEEERKIVDLCGIENLVLDHERNVRYLDSFHVFFHLDLVDVIADVDEALVERMELATKRLAYLESLVARLA